MYTEFVLQVYTLLIVLNKFNFKKLVRGYIILADSEYGSNSNFDSWHSYGQVALLGIHARYIGMRAESLITQK